MRKENQRKSVRAYLEQGNDITPLEALKLFGCMRLAAVIFDLKKRGMKIITAIEKRDGKRFARYYLEKKIA